MRTRRWKTLDLGSVQDDDGELGLGRCAVTPLCTCIWPLWRSFRLQTLNHAMQHFRGSRGASSGFRGAGLQRWESRLPPTTVLDTARGASYNITAKERKFCQCTYNRTIGM